MMDTIIVFKNETRMEHKGQYPILVSGNENVIEIIIMRESDSKITEFYTDAEAKEIRVIL